MSLELIAPDGSAFNRWECIAEGEGDTIMLPLYARPLVREKGAGVWQMKWHVEGILVHIVEVKLIE